MISKEEILKLIDEGKNGSQIAKIYSISRSTLGNYLRAYGINISEIKRNKCPYPTKEELLDLYVDKGISVLRIAKQYKMGYKNLLNLMGEYEIQIRHLGVNQYYEWTYEKVKNFFEEQGCTLLEKEYINCDTKMKYICSCGREDYKRFSAFKRGQRCNVCSTKRGSEKQKLTYEYIKSEFEKRGATLLSKEYVNAQTHLEYICHKCGEKTKMTWSNFKRGYGCSNCKRLQFSGENNPNYNPNLSDYDRMKLGRYEKGYKAFRRKVFARDKKCVICGHSKNKVVHHLDGYAENPELRTDINNAVALCVECHKKFHSLYGYGGNTKEQFNEFKEKQSILL